MLSWTIFLPAIGAGLCLFAPKGQVKRIALATTLATFVLSLFLLPTFLGGVENPEATFGTRYGTMHFVERATWITAESFTIEYFVGVDGLSFPLLILTTLVSFLACWASWNFEHWKINKGIRTYFILFLLLETGMLGVFAALDFFLFYVFWEVMLLPMYFLIGVWGGPRKEYAAIKFFLFTLAGSVLMLVALVAMYFQSAAAIGAAMTQETLRSGAQSAGIASGYVLGKFLTGGTFDLIEMATNDAIVQHFASAGTTFLGIKFAPIMFIFLFIGFAIKLPSFPFHTWLPDAHVEAPTPISMILAGVLLKMGGYGFLRLCYPIFPTAGEFWAFTLATVGVISILYGALCAMAQTDFKKLVAYSSVSHMGYVLLGVAIMSAEGFQGAMFQMLAHGISSPMCFFLVGVVYDRAHHRDLNRFGGLWLTMPKYGTMATIGFFASLGLPGLCGFIGEAWVLIGTFRAGARWDWAYPMAVLAAAGVILTAGYILWTIKRVYLGHPHEDPDHDMPEATAREMGILAPFAVLCIVMGVFPSQTVFNYCNGTLNHILAMMGTG
ncbi:MAG: oxidoreductase [Planctomycetota bacterium]|nr:MAG: oxidoreductase [Planctomycetota bacterium]